MTHSPVRAYQRQGDVLFCNRLRNDSWVWHSHDIEQALVLSQMCVAPRIPCGQALAWTCESSHHVVLEIVVNRTIKLWRKARSSQSHELESFCKSCSWRRKAASSERCFCRPAFIVVAGDACHSNRNRDGCCGVGADTKERHPCDVLVIVVAGDACHGNRIRDGCCAEHASSRLCRRSSTAPILRNITLQVVLLHAHDVPPPPPIFPIYTHTQPTTTRFPPLLPGEVHRPCPTESHRTGRLAALDRCLSWSCHFCCSFNLMFCWCCECTAAC